MVVAVALVAMGAFAPVAVADDQSVYDAWVSRDADFARLGREARSAEREWERSNGQRTRRFLRVIRATQRVLREVDAAINAQTPSSDNGTRGKTLALRSNAYFHASLGHLRRAIVAFKRRERRRAARHARAAEADLTRSGRAARGARRAFRAAGVQLR